MGCFGFQVENKWTAEEYIKFLENEEWKITYTKKIKSSLSLMYVECKKCKKD